MCLSAGHAILTDSSFLVLDSISAKRLDLLAFGISSFNYILHNIPFVLARALRRIPPDMAQHGPHSTRYIDRLFRQLLHLTEKTFASRRTPGSLWRIG